MPPPAISVRGLGKQYLLSHEPRQRYVALRDVLADGARQLAHRLRHPFATRQDVRARDEFWALRDIDFDIRPGERVGIIGRNGAGKSTLLKLLSRITAPTSGRIEIRGRVASLLEVGTGFHPELTGRENILLNGAILGMRRAEIRRKFDEIVAFAGVERFLDTPVKRYSSGMYVRLAFAVAAHLEPDILVVDEVLAVGDTEFQKKCLGRMSEIAGEGRTVLFVSHNMAAMEALCPRSLYLDAGNLMADGPTAEIVAAYVSRSRNADEYRETTVQDGLVLQEAKSTPLTIRAGDPADLQLCFRATRPGTIRECAILIYSVKGYRIAILDIRHSGQLPFAYVPGHFVINAHIDMLPFVEGEYSLGVYIVTNEFSGNLFDLITWEIGPASMRSEFAPYSPESRGIVSVNSTMNIAPENITELRR